jgi:hypothetical protein
LPVEVVEVVGLILMLPVEVVAQAAWLQDLLLV